MASVPLPEPRVPDGYIVRRALPAEAPFLAHCRTEMLRELDGDTADTTPEFEARVAAWAAEQIANGCVTGWVAVRGDEFAGGVMALEYSVLPMSASPEGRVGRIVGMYVEPAHRRLGLAAALTASALAGLHADGVRIVRLGASDAGSRVYASLGFEPFAEMGIHLADEDPL